MRILVTAKYVSGKASEGGASRFYKTVIDTLLEMGHEVIATIHPKEYVDEPFDLIICSHNLTEISANPARKVYISHGIIGDEQLFPGADRYIAVSEEARTVNRFRNSIDSEVIGQPIRIRRRGNLHNELRNILIIRREPVLMDPFTFLSEKYDLRYSDLSIPIEEQIEWADLCITLGRGALESMAQGKPVLVADNRPYIGPFGDGYVSRENIHEIARHNFSGRRFRHPATMEWIESELAKYNPADSEFLYGYVKENHDARKIVSRYLQSGHAEMKISWGVLCNDWMRMDMVFLQSEITGQTHYIKMPETATKGLNILLGIMEGEGSDVGILAHQDMFFRKGWIDQMLSQVALLPDSWIVAGIIGKDMQGVICGRIHDMRMPLHFSTNHQFPNPASCFDECCIIVNLKKGFRFDEGLHGFDLYGTLCVLQAKEMGGTAWIIDAFAEHYCMRPFTWYPGKDFEDCFMWIHQRFPNAERIDSTVIGVEREDKAA